MRWVSTAPAGTAARLRAIAAGGFQVALSLDGSAEPATVSLTLVYPDGGESYLGEMTIAAVLARAEELRAAYLAAPEA